VSDPVFVVSLWLVLITCVLCASVGFNRPTWSRSYTTAARYRLALAAHITLFLLLMLIVYAILRRGLTVDARAEGRPDPVSETALVWMSLAITLCVRAVSTQPRRWLQRMAGIPGHAKHRAAFLAAGEFEPDAKFVEQARATLLSLGIDLDSDWLPPARPTHRLLLRATALFIQLREWEFSRRFTGFAREAKNDFDLQRRRFEHLSFRVSRTLASIERLAEIKHQFTQSTPNPSPTEVDGLMKKIVNDLIADSCEDIIAFYDDACLLAVRGAMLTQPTRKGRNALLRKLGFRRPTPPVRAGYGILIPTGLLVYVGMWLFFLILPTPQADIHAKALIAVVSIVLLGSISMAIIPKRRWGFANTGLRGHTPYSFVIGAGVCAVLFSVIVQLTAGALLIGGIAGALERLHASSPWMLGVFATAATMAWLVQDTRWEHTPSRRMRRLRDAAVFGAVWASTALVGEGLDFEINHHLILSLTLVKTVLGSFVFGGLIGYTIPEGVRVNDPVPLEPVPRIGTPTPTVPLLRARPIDA